MSLQGSDIALPPSSAPAQEQPPTPPNPIGGASTTDPTSTKKIAGKKKKKKKALAKKAAKKSEPTESIDDPANQQGQYRYEPYRKADPTPEPEGSRPADLEELDTLDATARVLFKSDREVLEYVEALNYRAAAILEYATRTGSQLHSYKGVRGRIELFVDQRQKTGDQGTHQQLPEDPPVGVEALGSSESSDDEDDVPKQDLSPTLMYIQNASRTGPMVGEHFLKNTHYPDLSRDHPRQVLGYSSPESPNNRAEEENPFRPETPPARQPSLPPGHEDENGLEYVENMIEMRSDFSVPPHHADLASDDSTFNRSGADLRIASDTGLLFPLPDEEFDRISKEFKREAMNNAAALAMGPPTNVPHPRHPLAQSYIPSSSPAATFQLVPQHLVPPRPVLRTPSPSRAVLNRKRKRVSTPEGEEEKDAGNIAGPSAAAVELDRSTLLQVEASINGGRVSAKRRRLLTHQPTWEHEMFPEAGRVPSLPHAGALTHASEPASQLAHKQGSLALIGTSLIQKDSEIEKSQVFKMLGGVVEQGESEDEEDPTGIIISSFGMSHSFPALTADNGQGASTENTQSGLKLKTPQAKPQLSANAPVLSPEDVFGPVLLSVKANKISGNLPAAVSQNDMHGNNVVLNSEYETATASHKSTRFSLNGEAEDKEYKVFRKTPIRPRTGTSLRASEAKKALAAETEVERQDTLDPLPPSPKKKRAVGARARKLKTAPSVKPEPTINPEGGVPSISASNPPQKLRRGRSAAIKPDAPTVKAPVRKSTRNKK
ncbi:hypothetical protein BJ322DRAFT_1114057 [Thelephora terrestris]|uniref:Uncharacterized protein n=1 Tax=Thelephora terrestris TaxID=56493 RepID=A0A9P6H5V9_9AGAM|nr:hypothetical protein BJ322DRAFT_1114057 [Thelephora terrestris]